MLAAPTTSFLNDALPASAPNAPDAAVPTAAVARLARLHAEAVETARLANLPVRSLHVALVLPLLAALAVAFAGGRGLPATVAWAILIGVAVLSILRAYADTRGRPIELTALRAFARGLNACLLYAGLAWGAGAFLALANDASAVMAFLFAAAPVIAVALLLRERQAVLLFLAPVAALSSFAWLLRPFASDAPAAALVLIVSAAVAVAIAATSRFAAKRQEKMPPPCTPIIS